MIEVLFRGKRIDNDEWIEGSLATEYYKRHGVVMISPSEDETYKVDPDTIGQYIENDKNGKKIFTDSIVKGGLNGVVGVVRLGKYSNPYADDCHIGFYIEWEKKYRDIYRKDLGYWVKKMSLEVIGNIHDNPELLKGGNQ